MKPSSSTVNNRIVTAAVATASVIAITSAAVIANRRSTKKQQQQQTRTVVITGGSGNLATKLATHLLSQSQSNNNGFSYRVILIEHPNFYVEERLPDGAEIVVSDLLDGSCDAKWRRALKGAYAVVHFSAVNPYLNATWKESADSMMHNFNIVLASINSNVDRFILASSSHVMGGYKEQEMTAKISPDDPPMCGTFFRNPKDLEKSGNGVAYAAAKLAGEQICRAVAASQISKSSTPSTTKTTAVIALRIGWCQPGENLPSTLSAGGVPDEYRTKVDKDDDDDVDENDDDNNNINDEVSKSGSSVYFETQSEEEDDDYVDDGHDEKWFTNMWLSNQDFLTLFTAAIENKDLPRDTFTVVNAMSNNEGMRWSLEKTVNILGVMPMDDSRAKSES